MDYLGTVVKEGSWLYGGWVVKGVRIRRSAVCHVLGDPDAAVAVPAGPDGCWYYVEWDLVAGGDEESAVGPFRSLAEAEAFATTRTSGTVRWRGGPAPAPAGPSA